MTQPTRTPSSEVASDPKRTTGSLSEILRSALPPARGFLPLILLLVVWEVAAWGRESPYLPPPSSWWNALRTSYWDSLFTNLAASLQTFLIGLLIATLLGAAIGLAIGTVPWLRQGSSVLLEFLRTLPAPTVIPIALLLFGPGESTKLFAVVFAAVWPILMNTASAASQIDNTLIEVAGVYRLSRLSYVRKIALPAVVPYILIGVRVAVPIALIVTILVEMLISTPGVGRDLMHAQRAFRNASAFGLLFVVGVLGYLVNVGFLVLQGLVLRRWPQGAEVSAKV